MGETSRYTRGDLVQTWFDEGATGPNILYGCVIRSGPKAFKVMWESGLCNVFKHVDDWRALPEKVKMVDLDDARKAMKNVRHWNARGKEGSR